MPMVFIRHVGANLAFIHPIEGPVDPGFGWGGGEYPGHDLPGSGGHPWLPGHAGGPRPGHDLPHLPGIPDNSLPTTPPPHVPTGTTLVLVRDPAGVWHWATLPPGSPPPVIAPPIAPGGTPPVAGMPLPPTAAPKA